MVLVITSYLMSYKCSTEGNGELKRKNLMMCTSPMGVPVAYHNSSEGLPFCLAAKPLPSSLSIPPPLFYKKRGGVGPPINW